MTHNHTILKKIAQALLKKNESIAVAESVTAGYLQNAFSQMPNASNFFKGGITAYTPEIKIKLLKVDPMEAERENCVSKNIAEVMAFNAANLFNAEWIISITGYAKPVPESNHKLYAYYCMIYHGRIISSEKLQIPETFSPIEAQQAYVEKILNDLAANVEIYPKTSEHNN